ncbi:peptidase, partial [Niallia taxi]
ASIKDTLELEKVLSQLVKQQYCLLIVNHTQVNTIVELDWNINNVCAIEIPNHEIWDGNNSLWEHIFNGIKLV